MQADLNGDGKPEVLVAAPNGKLLVLAPRRAGDGFAPALVLSEVDLGALLDSTTTTTNAEPVTIKALSSGSITPRPKDLVRAPRKQIVVAVTTAGHVVVLDHNLKLLWKVALIASEFVELEEVAVMITDHAVNKGDRGLIVIGARFEPDAYDEADENDFEEIDAVTKGRAAKSKMDEVVSDRHFSYYAYSGDSGQLRWKHEAMDFHRDLIGLQESTVSTQHTLHAAAQLAEGIHYGEASCREYREAVLAALPHNWHSARDTHMKLAHFHRHKAHHGALKQQLSTLANNKQRTLLAATGVIKTPPNVIVAHVEEGIEAIHLYSGRTVCRLYLDPYVLHVDLNGDGIPDHVHSVGGDPGVLIEEAAGEDTDRMHSHSHIRYCAAMVTSGIPPQQELFNGTICRPLRFGLERGRKLGYIETAPPTSMPVPGHGGHYRTQVLRQKSNALFLTSRGDLSAYSSSGELMWQVLTGAFWRPLSSTVPDDDEDYDHHNNDDDESVDAFNKSEQDDDYEEIQHPQPTLIAMALRRHAIPSVVLAAGDAEASVLTEHGNEIVSLDLPERPVQPLSVVDFNVDGYNDIVLVGKSGVYGWAQVRRPGAVPFSALVGVLIVIMITVFIQQQGFMQPSGAAKFKGRSTDRVD